MFTVMKACVSSAFCPKQERNNFCCEFINVRAIESPHSIGETYSSLANLVWLNLGPRHISRQ